MNTYWSAFNRANSAQMRKKKKAKKDSERIYSVFEKYIHQADSPKNNNFQTINSIWLQFCFKGEELL